MNKDFAIRLRSERNRVASLCVAVEFDVNFVHF